MTNEPQQQPEIDMQRPALPDSVAASAQRDLHDTRYDWLRTPLRRKGLVVFALCTPVASGLAAFCEFPFIALLAFGGSWLLLRRARQCPVR